MLQNTLLVVKIFLIDFLSINAPIKDIDCALYLAKGKRQKWLYQGPWRWSYRIYMSCICIW